MRPFVYLRPTSVAEALQAVAGHDGGSFLAGGSNLVDLMKYGVESPSQLVDVTRLPLASIEPRPDGGLRIGALVRNSDLAADSRIARDYPVLAEALLSGASPQLRNMATTGGNLLQRTRCYYFYDTAFPCNKRQPNSGCPAIAGQNRIHAILGQSDACIAVHPSDMAVALAALDAVVRIEGRDGPRSIPVTDFYRLPGKTPQIETQLAAGELITAVDLPASGPARRSHYLKVRDRAQYAFALSSAAVVLETSGGHISAARIALGGVAHKPWRAFEAERLLVGRAPDSASFEAAADSALQGARGFAHNGFKVELTRRTLVRAFQELPAL